jgi:UDP:flavonoid glycosyltransferase YjiC (YdhE family)
LAWDLGAGRGHAVRIAALARGLRQRGDRVRLFARDLRTLHAVLEAETDGLSNLPLLPAPHNDWIVQSRAPAAWGDILWSECGLHDQAQTAAITRAWQSVLELSGVERLLVDAAPLAHLAAARLGIPSVAIGTGFLCPPPGPPWPVFRDWEPVDVADVRAREARIAEHLAALGATPDQLHGAASALFTWPDCDHYANRGAQAHYLGPLAGTGAAPQWPAGSARILLYLQPGYAHLPLLREALSALPDVAVLAYFGGAAMWPDDARLRVVTQPIDIGLALTQADLVISHGGNLAVLAAGAGVPSLLLPTQVEMYLTARRFSEMGIAVSVTPPFDALEFTAPLQRGLDPARRKRVREYAHSCQRRSDEATLHEVLALLDRV